MESFKSVKNRERYNENRRKKWAAEKTRKEEERKNRHYLGVTENSQKIAVKHENRTESVFLIGSLQSDEELLVQKEGVLIKIGELDLFLRWQRGNEKGEKKDELLTGELVRKIVKLEPKK